VSSSLSSSPSSSSSCVLINPIAQQHHHHQWMSSTTTSPPSDDQQQISTAVVAVTRLIDPDAVQNFIEQNQKSILYFTATWCPPCKHIKPIYEQLSIQYNKIEEDDDDKEKKTKQKKKKIHFGLIDVDENNASSAHYRISAVPTFILFHQNHEINRLSGADSNQLNALLQNLEKL
jgi:thiol-disulfide isomerase/thioredoxin